MKMRARSVLAALAAASVLALPAAAGAGAHLNGVFLATVTDDGSTPVEFELPANQPFPQATFPYQSFAAPEMVSLVSGLQLDLLVSVGEIPQGAVEGTMRLALMNIADFDPPLAFMVGTFTLEFTPDTGAPYQAHGVVVGDQYSFYLSGTDGHGTPETTDDEPFLLRANGHFTGAFGVGDQVFGRHQILVGGPLPRAAGGTVDSDRTRAGTDPDVPPILDPDPFTLNQFVPPDGTGDLAVVAGASSVYWTGIEHRGDMDGLPGPSGFFSFTQEALILEGGSSVGARGLSFGRFEWPAADGTLVQGFMVGDVEAPDGVGIPVEGRLFSLLSTRRGSADHFAGTYQGHFDGAAPGDSLDHATLAVSGGIHAVDAAPPEVVGFESGPWQAGTPVTSSSYTRDLNGWGNQRSVQLLLGTSRSARKFLARYDAARNRFQLYNIARRRWTAGCAPGGGGTLRVPQGRLSCAGSSVESSGEFLRVNWAITPTRRLVGTWNAFVQVVDRARISTGWRQLEDAVEVAPAP